MDVLRSARPSPLGRERRRWPRWTTRAGRCVARAVEVEGASSCEREMRRGAGHVDKQREGGRWGRRKERRGRRGGMSTSATAM